MERQEIIKRYEKIVKKWDSDPEQTLKRLFPDKYKDICMKLKCLQSGVEYTVTDVTKECVSAIGALMCGAQKMDIGGKRTIASTSRYQKGLRDFIDNFDKNGDISKIYDMGKRRKCGD